MPSKTKRKSNKKFNVVQFMLHLLLSVKLYHWITSSYATHEATNQLYNDLNTQIDTFVEVMLGKEGVSRNIVNVRGFQFKKYNLSQFESYIRGCKKTLLNLTKVCKEINENDTDLLNIRDEILALLNKFTYLGSFS
jgi:DNA-binding ferritin-like protein